MLLVFPSFCKTTSICPGSGCVAVKITSINSIWLILLPETVLVLLTPVESKSGIARDGLRDWYELEGYIFNVELPPTLIQVFARLTAFSESKAPKPYLGLKE